MLTIGNLLKKAREHAGKDIKEIAQYLKIKPRYLEQIENNDFSGFDSSTYVKGFIRSYASYLGLDAENIVAIFRRQIGEEEKPLKTKKVIKQKQSIVISPANIISAIVVLFFVGLFTFLIVQFYNLQQPPELKIISPEELVATVDDSSFQIQGITEENTVVTINNAQIQVRDDSTFAYNVELKKGINTYKVEAWKKNIEGEVAEKIVQITYKDGSSEETESTDTKTKPTSIQNPVSNNSLTVALSLSGDAWIKVIEDNIQKAVGVKSKGYSITLTPSEMVEITTGVPENSHIKVDGQEYDWRIGKGIGYLECSYETGSWECK